MFVLVFNTLAKSGREQDLMALAEQWQRERRPAVPGFLGGDLLRNATDPREFVWVARFESQEAARNNANDPAQDAWYRRLVALLEAEPKFTDCNLVRSF